MRNTRLILVTGMRGAGKSTTSKGLARQFSLNGVRCRWLHEECRRHPIRDKDSDGQVRAVRVSGDYDGEIMGATMQRILAGA